MRGRRQRWVALVLVGVSLFASGVAAGRGLADDGGTDADTSGGVTAGGATPHGRVPRAAQPDASGAERRAGARSLEGAVAAAAALVTAFDGPGMLDPARRERLLTRHSASDARERLGEVLRSAADTVTTRLGLDAEQLRDSGFVWRVVPAGWQIHDFDRDRAVVAVWATGVVIARGLPLTQPGWRTTEVEVVWERGDWRLVGFRSEPGPEPPLVGATSGASSQALLIDAFRPFRHVPAGGTTTATP